MQAVVSYNAEIEIKPVQCGVIRRKRDELAEITVWDLNSYINFNKEQNNNV